MNRTILRTLAIVLATVAWTTSASAQTTYFAIAYQGNFLAHTGATTLGNATTFDIETCLWTISGSQIVAVDREGNQGNRLTHNYSTTLSLSNSTNTWGGASSGSTPYLPSYTNYRLKYRERNGTWVITNQSSEQQGWTTYYYRNAVVYTVTRTQSTTVENVAEAYTLTLAGEQIITSTGDYAYSPTLLHTPAYNVTTTTTTFRVTTNATHSGSYSTTTAGDHAAATVDLGDGWALNYSVSPTTYGTIAGGTYTVGTLPATGSATATLSATATRGSIASTATLALSLFASEEEARKQIVVLDDREDHQWAYYNRSLGSPLRSWNPADVKITYRGKGRKYTAANAQGEPTGTASDIGSTADMVRVGPLSTETQNTFIYHKTLERTDGQTAAHPTGRCPYRLIANPFSVRPRIIVGNPGGIGSGATNYTGFYRWRLASATGGSVYATATGGTALSAGDMLHAEAVVYYAPAAEYGMEVVWEAVWTPARVNGYGATQASGTNAYERNFYITTGNISSALTYPATISSIYPDGTSGTSTALSTTVGGGQTSSYTCSADTKFEYTTMGAGITLTANNHYLCLGRGIPTTNTMQRVRGMSAGTSTALDYTLRIESGKMNYISFANGNYALRNTDGTTTTYQFSNTSNKTIRVVMGCDYDRASNDNSKLNLVYNAELGFNCLFASKTNRSADVTVKSGSISSNGYSNPGDGGNYYIYMGVSSTYDYRNVGLRRLKIEGGKLCNIAGGVDDGNQTDTSLYIRITGGEMMGAMYGAAAFATTYGHKKYVATGGSIRGWVAGGCNGTTTTSNVSGIVYGSTFMYIGGNTVIGYNDGTAAPHINSSDGGNLFGAGSGNELVNTGTATQQSNYRTVGQVYNSTIVIADSAYIQNNVFGGGNYGYVSDHGSDIRIMGGTIGGKLFGGSNQRTGKRVDITMTGGTVIGGVYGGSNMRGTIDGPVTVSIEGGTVGATGIDPYTSEVGHVFGNGLGIESHVLGDVEVFIGSDTATDVHVDSPIINGNVYGGGQDAAYTSEGKTFKVTGRNGLVKGNIFGGGKGTTATITGNTDLLLTGSIHVKGSAYGGGHFGSVIGNTNVNVQ